MAQTRRWLCVQLSGTQEFVPASGPGLMALCAQSCRSLLKGTQFFSVLYRLEYKMRPSLVKLSLRKGSLNVFKGSLSISLFCLGQIHSAEMLLLLPDWTG